MTIPFVSFPWFKKYGYCGVNYLMLRLFVHNRGKMLTSVISEPLFHFV